jgi:4-alpha-glucanotransferase
MIAERSSGILLHPTSLPGPYGAGDFGVGAYQFVDWLTSAGQSVWQVLPMGAIGEGNSPYMSSSAFAGNPLMIDLVDLGQRGWLGADDLRPDPAFKAGHVDYSRQFSYRVPRLRLAAERFFAEAEQDGRNDFESFCIAEQAWLDDYSTRPPCARRSCYMPTKLRSGNFANGSLPANGHG